MNPFDLIIIYLACGAPFAAHRHLQNRNNGENLGWLRTLSVFLFWFPYAFKILGLTGRVGKFFDSAFAAGVVPDLESERKLLRARRSLESAVAEALPGSTFGFRECLERYVGLTVTLRLRQERATETELEMARFGGTHGLETAAAVLHRRNAARLAHHQILARREFLGFTGSVPDPVADRIASLASEVCTLVGDASPAEETDGCRSGSASEPVRIWNDAIRPEPRLTAGLHTWSSTNGVSARD